MQEILAANGAELSSAEETGEIEIAKHLSNQRDIAVRMVIEPGPAPIAREQECAARALKEQLRHQQHLQIFLRGRSIPQVKLDNLTVLDGIANCNRTALGIDADNTANQEVTSSQGILLRVDGAADQQTVLEEGPIFLREPGEDFLDPHQRRLTVESQNDVASRCRDRECSANGTAAL